MAIKALFAGLGSIGQRHLANLRTVCERRGVDLSLSAFRKTGHNSIIKAGRESKVSSLSEYYGIKEYDNLDSALNAGHDIGFVCNPSSMHFETAKKMLDAGLDVFIEKPMVTCDEHCGQLEQAVEKARSVAMVGYQSRFDPCVKAVRRYLEKNEAGAVVSAGFSWLTYLPDHHKYEDYRQGYAARKDLGGGVAFCLIHELDLIGHLLGKPVNVYSQKPAGNCLEMTAEDTVSAIFQYGGQGAFPVSLNLSFAYAPERREFNILFERAVIECDLAGHSYSIYDKKGNVIESNRFDNYDRNEIFLSEIEHFIDCAQKRESPCVSITEAAVSTNMALAIHRSIETCKPEVIA
jgi:predicted dehydrogenase